MWGFYAIRPLTTTELQHVVAIEWPESKKAPPIYEAEVISESCSNLLMEESGRVRPIHYSVREFFTKPRPVGISPTYKDWVFELKASKCQLAVACLACLKKVEIAVRQYDLHYLLESCGGLIRLLSHIDYRFRLSFYCCHNSDKHLRYLGKLLPDVKKILDMISSLETETLQLKLNIRLPFDEIPDIAENRAV